MIIILAIQIMLRYAEIDEDGNHNGKQVTGSKHITRLGMNCFCWPGCLTIMFDRDVVGLLQIKDIRKNNDYAMWLKVVEKADCYLLHEHLARYRRCRKFSVSTHSYSTMKKWHYNLWHEGMETNLVCVLVWGLVLILFSVWQKKIVYVH